ncbi:Imm52 family immunity protein [Streptoalloteichus hindustanus]|uniref:Immunity protein 52 domain-containing protein n=1 Tax=Streptoalloteichus hindustanus TaxID=2017 RepID=A0A1M4XT03_STRHI|nr:Imm52 family immunity protein [Streptoalloteichus hindustanus]SHE96568.1 hypothetical protein SAMN05444320_102110 [Streptoalloteichus hindustanus]
MRPLPLLFGELTHNYFYLGAYWGPRQEGVDECAGRLARFLRQLEPIDPILSSWRRVGRSKAAATPLQHTPKALRPVVESGRNRSGGQVFEHLGFVFSVWNGDRERSVQLRSSCGSYAAAMLNTVVVSLPDLDTERDISASLYDPSKLSGVLEAVADTWDPDWGIVTSSSMREDQSENREQHIPYVGAMTYLSLARPLPDVLPEGVSVEQVAGGHLLTIGEDVTAVTSEKALALRDVLASAGSLYPTLTDD